MFGTLRKIVRIATGIFLVVFGLVALIVPLFPFAWVALVGFWLLGVDMSRLEKLKKWIIDFIGGTRYR